MNTPPIKAVCNDEFGTRRSTAILLLILLVAGLCSTFQAVAKPFWYDEICTVIICKLPNASEISKALDHAADTNPPAYYLIARLARQVIPDDHLGYRLPSLLGLLGTVICVYGFLSRRGNRLAALAGATFLLCTSLASYAFEARPYAPMVACIAAAILAWQRIDDAKLYAFVLAAALAAAVSLHYYALLVWPAFVLAEASVWLFTRRLRIASWGALCAGATPLLFFAHLLMALRRYYGKGFWAQPRIYQVFSTQDSLYNFGKAWGATFAIGATLALAGILIWEHRWRSGSDSPASRNVANRALPIEEGVLTLVLLWVPLVAVVAAKIGHGAMAARYTFPTVLGGALAVGYLTGKVPVAVRLLALILLLINYGFSSVYQVADRLKAASSLRNVIAGLLLDQRRAAAREVKEILAQCHNCDLPVVVSSGYQYLPMVYYTPVDLRFRLYAITDPQASLVFNASDSVDLALLVLRQYSSLQVEGYRDFAGKHRDFLLVSQHDVRFDWWPARLSRDGQTLRLLGMAGNNEVYRVTLLP